MEGRHPADYFTATGSTRESFNRVVQNFRERIVYSERYQDDRYEYRHVRLPQEYKPLIPARLMSEEECRLLGVQQSPGWQHFMVHRPEPWILLFRRPLPLPQSAAS